MTLSPLAPLGQHDSALFDVAFVRIVDGDTVRLQFRPYRVMPTEFLVVTNVRLLDVWAAEDELPEGVLAELWTEAWFASHLHGRAAFTRYMERTYLYHLEIAKGFKATLGRTIGTVSCHVCGATLNLDIVTAGFATKEKPAPKRATM